MRTIDFRAASLSALLLLGGPSLAFAQNPGTNNTTGGTAGGVVATPPADGTQAPGTGHVGTGPAATGASTPGNTNSASNGGDRGGGWWGLLGLIGLAGLAGGRRRTVTTVDDPARTSVGASEASRRL